MTRWGIDQDPSPPLPLRPEDPDYWWKHVPSTCVNCDWFAGRPDDVCTLYDELIKEPITTDCNEWRLQEN